MKSLLDKINAKLNAQGGFLKAVSVLVGGTAFAQLIAFLSLPFLTRLYSPEDYSILGIYIALVSILSVVSCLRFDIAIPIPQQENEGKALLILALLSNTIFFILLYILMLLIYPLIEEIKVVKQLSYWIWLVPFGVYISGLYSALQYWATRHKRFKDIAQTRMTQAVFGNCTSLTIGVISGGFWGLILGQILNFSGGLLKLSTSAKKDLSLVASSPLKDTFFKYSNFPKYSTFEALANTSAIQLPLIIIASFIVGPEVGFLMMAMKILAIPMGLLGSAIAQVYLANANNYLENKELYGYTKTVIFKILKIITLPFIFLAILSPFIFTIIFGKGWSGLGVYILYMIPWFFMQMLVSPVSMSLNIIGKQKVALIIQIIGFILRVLGLVLWAILFDKGIIEYYFFSSFIFYILYLLIVMYCLKGK
ncbi:oligosaccharide flippase family protein [Acinetobacter gerneri]|uniref:oligosaccharide flippase family protein n=1 Tax=Acinetobacter gerneri TaxID=202952 RepID=UPI003AF9CB8E